MLLSDVLNYVVADEIVMLCDNNLLDSHPIYGKPSDLMWWLDCDQYPVKKIDTDLETGRIRITVDSELEDDSND